MRYPKAGATTNLKRVPRVNNHDINYLFDKLETGSDYIGNALDINNSNELPFSWSLRVLKREYEGLPLIRVRRSSDNSLADIFSIKGELDINGLLGFVGSSDGYIHTWYNQTRSDINAVQTTNESQPRIVSAGVLDTVNGKPAIYFAGSQFLSCGANTDWQFLHYRIETSYSAYFVFHPGIVDNPNTIYVICGTTITVTVNGAYFAYDDRASVPTDNSAVHVIGTTNAGNIVVLNRLSNNTINTNAINYMAVSCLTDAAASQRSLINPNKSGYQNNNTNTSTHSSGNANHELRIGTAANATGTNQAFMVGYQQELVFFKRRTEGSINDGIIERDVYQYYNII